MNDEEIGCHADFTDFSFIISTYFLQQHDISATMK